MKGENQVIRVLVSKIGLDGHNRGAYVVAHGLKQAGMEVIYTGIRQTPASVAKAAVQEDVDVIGVSSMVGAHLSIMTKLNQELAKLDASNIPIIIGGIIPDSDYDKLKELGVKLIFRPGSNMDKIINQVKALVEDKEWVPEIKGTLTGDDIDDISLMGSKCDKCSNVFFPSRRRCPICLDEKSITDIRLSDRGTLSTFAICQTAPLGYEIPHVQGYVELNDNGPPVFSLLIRDDEDPPLAVGCSMQLEIIERGTDNDDKKIMGYRFKPLTHT
ncbi:cobalamin-dependent protein [bacterium]|nr:cobalamin-dependent protein [bacterium]